MNDGYYLIKGARYKLRDNYYTQPGDLDRWVIVRVFFNSLIFWILEVRYIFPVVQVSRIFQNFFQTNLKGLYVSILHYSRIYSFEDRNWVDDKKVEGQNLPVLILTSNFSAFLITFFLTISFNLSCTTFTFIFGFKEFTSRSVTSITFMMYANIPFLPPGFYFYF